MSFTRERSTITEQSEPDTLIMSSSRGSFGRGDRIFATIAAAAGVTILIALAAVFIFLLIQGARGFHAPADVYRPAAHNFWNYAGKLLFGTALSALLAMIIAVPFAIGLALFISHYAPRRLAVPVAYVIDILAAVPSVVYGLWGARTLAPASHGVQTWLNTHVSWIPLFAGEISATGRTILIAAVVLAIMVLPISTAICREVFQQTPRLIEEAALGLGATRWEMIKYAVFPHARSGMVAGMMLGLGRALGETIAVAMVSGALLSTIAPNIYGTMGTVAATIVTQLDSAFTDGTGFALATLAYLAVALAIVSLIVNALARVIVNRTGHLAAPVGAGF